MLMNIYDNLASVVCKLQWAALGKTAPPGERSPRSQWRSQLARALAVTAAVRPRQGLRSTSSAMRLSAQLPCAAWPGGSRARGRWPSHARFRPVLGRLIFGTASCHRPARRPVTVWQLEVGTKAERGASPTSSEIGPARRGLGRTLILTGWQHRARSSHTGRARDSEASTGASGRTPHRPPPSSRAAASEACSLSKHRGGRPMPVTRASRICLQPPHVQ